MCAVPLPGLVFFYLISIFRNKYVAFVFNTRLPKGRTCYETFSLPLIFICQKITLLRQKVAQHIRGVFASGLASLSTTAGKILRMRRCHSPFPTLNPPVRQETRLSLHADVPKRMFIVFHACVYYMAIIIRGFTFLLSLNSRPPRQPLPLFKKLKKGSAKGVSSIIIRQNCHFGE